MEISITTGMSTETPWMFHVTFVDISRVDKGIASLADGVVVSYGLQYHRPADVFTISAANYIMVCSVFLNANMYNI